MRTRMLPKCIGGIMTTNIKFLSVRRFANLEWEVFEDDVSDIFIAILHKKSICLEDKTWDGLWEKILDTSRSLQKG